MFHVRPRTLFSRIVLAAGLPAGSLALAFSLSTAAAQTTVQVHADKVYYELPRWSVGAKMTAYCSDFAGGDYPSDPKRAKMTTPDGKNWRACIKEMKLGFIGASIYSQGRPPTKGKPLPNYDDWRSAADAVVEGGGGIMIEYMGGPAGPPGMPKGSTNKPEAAENIDQGEWSVQNCIDWADYMAARHGADKIFLFEFYNEPACMGEDSNGIYWYSQHVVKDSGRMAADWAINHQQDFYKAVKAKYPDAVLCGASFAATGAEYSAGEARRFLEGYPGARISASNPNTKYLDAVSLHGYGFEAGDTKMNAPGAAFGQVQAIFNSVFYPRLKQPGKVAGYKAGADQWINIARKLPGGKACKLVQTEWWVYSPEQVDGWYPAGGAEGSHQAVADVLGWIVHCQNADRWQFRAIQYHAAGISEGRKPDAQGRPTVLHGPDSLGAESGGKIWRLGRYFAIKDICARFANNYQSLVRCDVHGPKSPSGPRDNSPGTQIQSCAALSKDKSALAVCLANIGDKAQTVQIALSQPVTGQATGVKVPAVLDVETPLTKVVPEFTDDSHETVTVTLDGFTAALVEIPLK